MRSSKDKYSSALKDELSLSTSLISRNGTPLDIEEPGVDVWFEFLSSTGIISTQS